MRKDQGQPDSVVRECSLAQPEQYRKQLQALMNLSTYSLLMNVDLATSAQRRCHPQEALYLPTFSHLLIVNKLLSLYPLSHCTPH